MTLVATRIVSFTVFAQVMSWYGMYGIAGGFVQTISFTVKVYRRSYVAVFIIRTNKFKKLVYYLNYDEFELLQLIATA